MEQYKLNKLLILFCFIIITNILLIIIKSYSFLGYFPKKKACISTRKPGFFFSTNLIIKNARNGNFYKKKRDFYKKVSL